jgi:hypothetical protein
VDPPPFFADTRRPETPSGGTKDEPTEPDRRPDRRSTDEDTDVSEFLRELSRLALGEDAPPTPRRSDVEPPPPGNAPRARGRGRGGFFLFDVWRFFLFRTSIRSTLSCGVRPFACPASGTTTKRCVLSRICGPLAHDSSIHSPSLAVLCRV